MRVAYTLVPSPLGELLLTAESGALTGLFMRRRPDTNWQRDDQATPFSEVTRQLQEYFAGERRDFDVPLRPQGTEFQLKVWRDLRSIPYGETITYGEQARRLGLDRETVRSVGTVNGQNPICIIVPCHRVLGADGKLTGYSGGLDNKRKLLELESPVRSLFSDIVSEKQTTPDR